MTAAPLSPPPLLVLLLAAALGGAAPSPGDDDPPARKKYEVVTPKDDMVEITGINARGEVVGFEWVEEAKLPGVVAQLPFFGRGKELTRLPLLEGYTATFPAALSDDGLVVGRASKPLIPGVQVPLRNQAFVWDAKRGIRGLGAPENGAASFACGVSRDGARISGMVLGDNRSRPCVWERQGAGDDATWKATILPNSGHVGSQVVAISDDGRLVAGADGASPCLWTLGADGTWTREVLGPGGSMAPRGVNNAGVVVGRRGDGEGATHAVIWTRADGLRLIPEPEGYSRSEANAVNNAGAVVGFIDGPHGSDVLPRAFVYEDGKVRILDEGGIAFSAANAINDRGQVAGVIVKDEDEPEVDGLGDHRRKVTTESAAAQRAFDQGLNLLFAFNHDEATRVFRKAAELDPACAMAWWGVAVAQGPHINRPVVDAAAAKVASDAIARARANLATATDRERGLVDALARRCVAEVPADRAPLDRAYAEAMGALRAKYPDDVDIAAFAAEALMDLRPWDLYTVDGRPQPGTEAIVALIEEALKLDPRHPLANHLYIHAVEASGRPERAEAAADRLRDLQPGLSHNVHMPSHIDVRLGHWAKAEESNRRAIEADRRFLAIRADPGFYGLYIAHNYHMLAYAAMMRGRGQVAVEAIDEMMAKVPAAWARDNAAIADGFVAMPLEVRMRFGRWDEILAAPEPDPVFPIARALRHYVRAVALAAQDRPDEARAEQAAFRAARARVPEGALFGNNKAADLLAVAEHAMDGELLYRAGRADDAFAALREAARLQDLLRYSEPPDWILPVRHALGAALIQSRRFAEAEQVYRDDLGRLPENGWALFGLAQALEGQDRTAEARAVRDRRDAAWKDADVALTSSCFCIPGR